MFEKLRKEPLVYFALLGVALFYFYTPEVSEDELTQSQIELPQGFIDDQTAKYSKMFNKAPSQQELQVMLDQEVSEEVMFREAWRLQLYVGDTVVRKRMIQKMNFLLEQGSASATVSEDEISEYYKENTTQFIAGRNFDLVHMIFSTEQHANVYLQRISAEDGALPANPEGTIAFPLGNVFSQISSKQTKQFFGTDFFDQLDLEKSDSWQGVVQSRYGAHLVKLSNVSAETTLTLNQATAEIEKNLLVKKKEESRLEAISKIKQRYQVVFPG